MEFVFIDESGDNGFASGSTTFFILAGIAFESTNWKQLFYQIFDLRHEVAKRCGLLHIDEFKGSDLFSHRGVFFNSLAKPADLVWIHERLIDLICSPLVEAFVSIKWKQDFRTTHAHLKEKQLPKAFSEEIWREFLTNYEAYLFLKSKRTGRPQTALLYGDSNPGQEKYIRKIVREFARKFNETSEFPQAGIVEDIIFRDSMTAPFLQLADVLAFSLNRIVTGGKGDDVFQMSLEIRERLKIKIGFQDDT